MTMLIMDGFDLYGPAVAKSGNVTQDQGLNHMLNGVWGEVTGNNTPATYQLTAPSWGARTGTQCFAYVGGDWNSNASAANPSYARMSLPTNQSHFFVSFGFSCVALPRFASHFSTISYISIMSFRDISNNVIANLCLSSSGALFVINGEASSMSYTQIGPASGNIMKTGTWQFIELEYNATAGTLTVRVDDQTASLAPALAVTGLPSTAVAQLGFACFNGTVSLVPTVCTAYWDDLVIHDTNGSYNNGWLGDRRVATLLVDADSTPQGWTPNYLKKFDAGVLDNYTGINACVTTPGSASLDLGSGDYTLESWIRFGTVPFITQYATLFSRWNTANNHRGYRLIYGGPSYNSSCIQLDYSTDGTASTITTPLLYPWSPNANQWYHIALVRASGELLLFIDGNQLGLPIADTTVPFTGSTIPLGIFGEVDSSSTPQANTCLTGWADETRVTIGYARYTAPFTPTGPFPRGASMDPQWANVSLLSGYNSTIQDESSFGRALTSRNGSAAFIVTDGPAIGQWSTVGVPKQIPNDNTFISAPYLPAQGIVTMTTQPANGDTITLGTKDGTHAAVYTFKNTITTAFDIHIDATSAQNTLLNLFNAINSGPGAGTNYGTGTTANFDVSAFQLPAGQLQINALLSGTGGNSIAMSKTGTAITLSGSTLTGGTNIPGPSNFKVSRPPPTTTLISAMMIETRMAKTDSGICTVQPGFVGPLGTLANGGNHNLSVNPSYYTDILETDPDTGGAISPATILNGKLVINRTT